MKIILAKQARRPPLASRTSLLRAIRTALKHSGLHAPDGAGSPDTELHVILTDGAGIEELNRQFLGHEGQTDVISFDLREPDGSAPDGVLGEIYVCLDVAVEAGKRLGTGTAREIVLYVVHGILHLAGEDDDTPSRRRAMRAAEDRIMAVVEENVRIEDIFCECPDSCTA